MENRTLGDGGYGKERCNSWQTPSVLRSALAEPRNAKGVGFCYKKDEGRNVGLLWDALIYIHSGAESKRYYSSNLDELSLPWEPAWKNWMVTSVAPCPAALPNKVSR